jgi:geranylgeranyl pyrophosphate synthase
MKVFGYEIGIAFQIVDDMLDFTGDQARVGKPVASDLRQGVITLPALTYYKEYPDDPILQSIIQGERPTEKSIKELLKHIRKSGAIEQTFQKAKEYVEKGQSRLIDMTPSPERDALIQLAEYVVQRPF